ncbi:glycoside hydrolase family 3 N-terminal domain-containing protein [Tabrizicola oligotrophica]|uniref:Glycoside hydrolase n=1 Tax=Tabrizicola oligotrophica TaxID=2710650 RepID=A0A6M0QXF2_9RHOB|nr:glycoside hydrolase family 3 N-terminal domain-containing protein [Tabrizicola oligotrophica]NEY92067.1 glycoside hydrolase [Tabrizicola oligotrophica]
MTTSIEQDAHAVLLPAFDGTTLSDATLRCLDRGGVSILLGESRAEYVARRMSADRIAAETPDTFRKVTATAKARSGRLLSFVDQEMGGICRLHDLVPQFPDRAMLGEVAEEQIERTAQRIAEVAAGMGVNGFLAPIVDVLIGQNPWLNGRTWSTNAEVIGRQSAAYVRGVQRAGVAATVKHFPGFGATTGDPATDAETVNPLALQDVEAGLIAFEAPIRAGAELVMVGPAIVSALDASKAALRSGTVIALLRQRMGFAGVIMADDLDSAATLQGSTVAEVAVDALSAGCDLLLLADIDDQLDQVAAAIAAAARNGRISAEALAVSAQKVRALADRYATA